MKEPPLVSYVVAVYNMEETIGNTIESLLNQDYPNKEIIVINDGSVDNTEKILKKYPIKYITTENKGLSHAKTFGYKISKGEFIAYTDADCVLHHLWTKNMLEGFIDDNVALVGGRTIYQTDGKCSSTYRSLEYAKRERNMKNSEVVWAGGQGSMFRRKILDELGGFNPKWNWTEDAQISFVIIEHGYKIIKKKDAITYHVALSGFKRVVRKGYKNAKGYVRATISHPKTSLINKFNTTWLFPYDMVLLPFLYAFMILLGILLLTISLLNFYLYLPIISEIIRPIMIWIMILIGMFLFVYGFIPSYQVASHLKNKKLKNFVLTMALHHTRGLFWGLGLIIGIINTIIGKR